MFVVPCRDRTAFLAAKGWAGNGWLPGRFFHCGIVRWTRTGQDFLDRTTLGVFDTDLLRGKLPGFAAVPVVM